MSNFQLRPYQSAIIDGLRAAFRKHKSVLAVAPTGAGKTALAINMIGSATSKGRRSFFICHRAEIIEQTAAAFRMEGIPFGYIAAGYSPTPSCPIQLCSIDTLKNRLDKIQPPDLLVWDECHHGVSKGWTMVKDYYSKAHHVGLTATPERLDGKGLGTHFTSIVEGPTVKWLIDNGYLCDYKLYAAPRSPDLSDIHSKMGDYDKTELSELMDKPQITGDAISHYGRLSQGKRAVVFAISIKHSEHIMEQFRYAGIPAEHIDGTMDRQTRRGIISRFRSGQTLVVVNVGIISEGFDLPDIESVILLRPTASLALYLQMVGRSLRPMPNKPHAIILDHAGNAMRHGLPDDERVWTLEGKKRSKKDKNEVAIRQCPQCFAVHHIAPVCPECGFVYVRKSVEEIKTVDGELQEVDKEAMRRSRNREQSSARTIDELVALARRRGYRNIYAWSAYVWSARQAKKRGV